MCMCEYGFRDGLPEESLRIDILVEGEDHDSQMWSGDNKPTVSHMEKMKRVAGLVLACGFEAVVVMGAVGKRIFLDVLRATLEPLEPDVQHVKCRDSTIFFTPHPQRLLPSVVGAEVARRVAFQIDVASNSAAGVLGFEREGVRTERCLDLVLSLGSRLDEAPNLHPVELCVRSHAREFREKRELRQVETQACVLEQMMSIGCTSIEAWHARFHGWLPKTKEGRDHPPHSPTQWYLSLWGTHGGTHGGHKRAERSEEVDALRAAHPTGPLTLSDGFKVPDGYHTLGDAGRKRAERSVEVEDLRAAHPTGPLTLSDGFKVLDGYHTLGDAGRKRVERSVEVEDLRAAHPTGPLTLSDDFKVPDGYHTLGDAGHLGGKADFKSKETRQASGAATGQSKNSSNATIYRGDAYRGGYTLRIHASIKLDRHLTVDGSDSSEVCTVITHTGVSSFTPGKFNCTVNGGDQCSLAYALDGDRQDPPFEAVLMQELSIRTKDVVAIQLSQKLEELLAAPLWFNPDYTGLGEWVSTCEEKGSECKKPKCAGARSKDNLLCREHRRLEMQRDTTGRRKCAVRDCLKWAKTSGSRCGTCNDAKISAEKEVACKCCTRAELE